MKPGVYTRPAKPLVIPVRRRGKFTSIATAPLPEPVMVDRATECHVTPPDVAARMVAYLGRRGDINTLEPSAGTGNLSRALIESGHSSCELVQVERHWNLVKGLYQFGAVNHRCFLECAEEWRGRVIFPRVIMNPPFSDVRKHIAAALSLLGDVGHEDAPPTLVALVPVTFERPGFETLETLPDDTFSTARVNTKIVRYRLGAP